MSSRIFSKPSAFSKRTVKNTGRNTEGVRGNSLERSSNEFVTKPPSSSNTKKTIANSGQITEEYRSRIAENAYIGKKGYTISKSTLTPQDEEFLKKDLYVSPVVHGASYGVVETSFPVYRENANKIYIPRFYGISRYGLPPKTDIEPGTPISVRFDKPLRDYQEKIVKIYTDHVQRPICADTSTTYGGGAILEVPCGRGKCLAKNTEIMMYDGTVKLVQDVVVGDFLMGDDSTPRKVLSLARGREMMYKISAASSTAGALPDEYIVNKSHILSLKDIHTQEIVDISLMDYFRHLQKIRSSGGVNPYKGYRVPITFTHNEPEVDPYVLGTWLFAKTPVVFIPPAFLKKYGILTNITSKSESDSVSESDSERKSQKFQKFQHIPRHYLCNSRDVQLRMFAGIMDTICPEYNGDYYNITIESNELYSNTVFLARSLGFVVEPFPNNTMRIYIHPTHLTYDIHVERTGIDEYYGFEIDGNRRFVLGNFAVTHNTIMALNIVSILQTKTLILVHKEFLMNQWIERIADFLPGARVGKIQGQTFDIEDKDIVIGMIQTLYDREFPANAFASFGLTIIDEVHRIGSEQFSKTLLRIITPYMLGISATVERKDGLTKVLNMFIGDKIYTEDRENDDPVCVRAVEYVSADPEFNEVVMDYRGNPQYSTMISKLCAYNRRNDFIVKILADLVEESPDNQIMILAHQRGILTYLFDAIRHRNIATVGFYVGGMKQNDLQDTEQKQIVLATYAMAAEALDIKTLSTLVMITPKTDIIQSVGRILRVKHDNPIIVDIVDKHDLFQKQWLQRRRFYKKCNYRIRQIDSNQYKGMAIDWETDRTWRRVFEPKPPTVFLGNVPLVDSDDDNDDAIIKPLASRKCMIDIDECFGDITITPHSL